MFDNQKKIQEMMKGLKMNVEEIKSEEVIIKCRDKNIIVSKPHVMLTNIMGKDVYQITGEVSESAVIDEGDIATVMEKTGKGRGEVVKKLEEMDNDLAKAIRELKGKR